MTINIFVFFIPDFILVIFNGDSQVGSAKKKKSIEFKGLYSEIYPTKVTWVSCNLFGRTFLVVLYHRLLSKSETHQKSMDLSLLRRPDYFVRSYITKQCPRNVDTVYCNNLR